MINWFWDSIAILFGITIWVNLLETHIRHSYLRGGVVCIRTDRSHCSPSTRYCSIRSVCVLFATGAAPVANSAEFCVPARGMFAGESTNVKVQSREQTDWVREYCAAASRGRSMLGAMYRLQSLLKPMQWFKNYLHLIHQIENWVMICWIHSCCTNSPCYRLDMVQRAAEKMIVCMDALSPHLQIGVKQLSPLDFVNCYTKSACPLCRSSAEASKVW